MKSQGLKSVHVLQVPSQTVTNKASPVRRREGRVKMDLWAAITRTSEDSRQDATPSPVPSAPTLRYPSHTTGAKTVRTWLHVLPSNTTYKPSDVLGQCHPSFPIAEAAVRSIGTSFSKCVST